MRPTVYIETTVVSYLTAWPTKDRVRAAQQELTREWWEGRRSRFDLHTSQLVIDEATRPRPASGWTRCTAARCLT